MNWLILMSLVGFAADVPLYEAEQIFPVNPLQTHAPSIVECANGDLLASWYQGSEGSEGDASIHGARKRKGDSKWSELRSRASASGETTVEGGSAARSAAEPAGCSSIRSLITTVPAAMSPSRLDFLLLKTAIRPTV